MNSHPRLATFSHNGISRYGLVKEDGVVDLSVHFASQWPTLREVIAAGALGELVEKGEGLPTDFSLADIAYEIPIPAPEKIICVGVNYPDRNAEYKDGQEAPPNPSLFIRFPGSFVGHEQNVIRPFVSERLDYEGEVVMIIGKAGRHISEENALDHIAALTLCNEGTIRDWVRHAKFNVTQGKNFESSGAMGPWIIPYEDESQIADIRLETRVNGEVRQQDRTSRMIFTFRKLINYISTFTALTPGDVIVAGTPTGAGARFDPPIWLKPGDVVEIEAEGIGVLRNEVADEAAPE